MLTQRPATLSGTASTSGQNSQLLSEYRGYCIDIRQHRQDNSRTDGSFGNCHINRCHSLSCLLWCLGFVENVEVIFLELSYITAFTKVIPVLVESFTIFWNRDAHSYGLKVLASSIASQIVATCDKVVLCQDDLLVHR